MEMVNMGRSFSTWHFHAHTQDVPLFHARQDPVAVVKTATIFVRGMVLELVKTASLRNESNHALYAIYLQALLIFLQPDMRRRDFGNGNSICRHSRNHLWGRSYNNL